MIDFELKQLESQGRKFVSPDCLLVFQGQIPKFRNLLDYSNRRDKAVFQCVDGKLEDPICTTCKLYMCQEVEIKMNNKQQSPLDKETPPNN